MILSLLMDYLGTTIQLPPEVIFLLFLWSLLWRGLALWKSAKLGQRNWFIVLFIVTTVGILDIVYLFGFAKKKMTLQDLKFWEALSK